MPRFRFRIRTLFVATLVAALFVAHYSWHKRVRLVENRVLQWTNARRFAGYADGPAARFDSRFDLRHAPCGLPRVLCHTCFGDGHHVIMVEVDSNIRPDAFQQLGDLPYLQGLIVRGDVRPFQRDLPRLKRLRYLCLHATRATDCTVENIGNMVHLRQLRLSHTAVTDECIGDLSRLHQLESLTVHRTKITSAGLVRLRQLLPSCRVDY